MMILNDATRAFIAQHRTDDVRKLALLGRKPHDVDLPLALQQIQGWQTARSKLPSWAEREGIIFPPHLNMEQCSSQATARYKRALVLRLCGERRAMADLTGGMGIDFSTLATAFDRAIYVERNPVLCQLMEHNGRVLGLNHAEVRCADCADALPSLPPLDLIFMDPARRDSHGGKVFALSDCQPDVLSLRDALLQKARVLLLKLSPMLDWHEAIRLLGCVREVHIVATGNECKELLLVCGGDGVGNGCVACVNDGQTLTYPMRRDTMAGLAIAPQVAPGDYLYEPNASVMKAGCFGLLCENYAVHALAHDSHLFTSPQCVADFPGRRFRIQAVSTLNKKALRPLLADLKQANIAVRNFPLMANDLRKRLRLRDGGDTYLFATTLQPASSTRPEHILLMTEKI